MLSEELMSTLISDGSELLLLVPSLAGIVGPVVLPILGAVPDGAIVLFSGLGPDAQEQVSVGVGALAGSTIMLLTVPWFMSVFGGRVEVRKGTPRYRSYHNKKQLPSMLNCNGSRSRGLQRPQEGPAGHRELLRPPRHDRLLARLRLVPVQGAGSCKRERERERERERV
eukprot:GHVU01047105.1.p1 GENE.GHVU01047105.1~~GHVU01047105.1.p1  ORF type:complete len:169 (-),score=23.09 GHVU01047105.1:76-582(-)